MAGTGSNLFDIGGKRILGLTIPRIPIAAELKKVLKSPGEAIQTEVEKTVRRGIMVPVLIGAGIVSLAIIIGLAMSRED